MLQMSSAGFRRLLRGQFERIGEDLPEKLEVLLCSRRRTRGTGLQDEVERVEDLGPVAVGDADDVADDAHRENVGDVVDPVAATGGQQLVDHRGGPRADAVLELVDGSRGERVGHDPAPLVQLRWIHVDDGRERADDAHALDERPVDGRERVGVAVNALGVPVFCGHPEVALDGLGHSRREFVMKDRPVAAQLGEQVIGETIAPQREIGQVD